MNVLSDIKLPISPSFPLICMLHRLCPHPPAATRPPVCCPVLKQTHLAHIPRLRRTGLFTVSEPLPENTEKNMQHEAWCTVTAEKHQVHLSQLIPKYPCVCHLLLHVNSA